MDSKNKSWINILNLYWNIEYIQNILLNKQNKTFKKLDKYSGYLHIFASVWETEIYKQKLEFYFLISSVS